MTKTKTIALVKKAMAASAVFVAAGCSMLEPAVPAAEVSAPPAVAAVPLGNDEVLSRFSSLPSQQIAAGECGLFLWAKRPDRPLVFFQRSGGPAFMVIDGKSTQLLRTAADEQIALQFHKQQSFTGTDLAIKVSVAPEQSRSLQQGLKLPSGSISVSTASGWSAVIPVAGAIGCQ